MQVILRKVPSSFRNNVKFSGFIDISLKCNSFNGRKKWLSIRGNTRYFRFQRKSIITQNVLILTGWTFLRIYVIPKSICMPIFMRNGSRVQKILTKVCQKWKKCRKSWLHIFKPCFYVNTFVECNYDCCIVVSNILHMHAFDQFIFSVV